MDEVSVGDLVRLRAGGPEMMVIAVTALHAIGSGTPAKNAICIYEIDHRNHEDYYPLHELEVLRRDCRQASLTPEENRD